MEKLAQILAQLFAQALLKVEHAQVVQGIGVIRQFFEDGFKSLRRPIQVAAAEVGHPQVVAQSRQARRILHLVQGGLVARRRLGMPALGQQQVAQHTVGQGVLGVQADGFAEAVFRLGFAAQLLQGKAAVKAGGGLGLLRLSAKEGGQGMAFQRSRRRRQTPEAQRRLFVAPAGEIQRSQLIGRFP